MLVFIRNKKDSEDAILRLFIGAYQNDSKKRIIFKLYKELMKKKLQTTEYDNQKWEKQGNFLILDESWWLAMWNFVWKCANSQD